MKIFKLIYRLFALVKPLLWQLLGAVFAGFLGFASVTLIAVLGASLFFYQDINVMLMICLIIILGLLKGILKYAEQWLNHYIAFKVLAHIRDMVFKSLRRLAPAKLSGKNQGDLISHISSDVEILEAFYAHTISPVFIALIYALSLLTIVFIFEPVIGVILLTSYIILGVVMPLANYKLSEYIGIEIKEKEANLKNIAMENFNGLKDIKQFGIELDRTEKLRDANNLLEALYKKEKRRNGLVQALIILTECLTICTILGVLISKEVTIGTTVLLIVAGITSFKPLVNVANVAGILVHSFASGKRIIDLIDEIPEISEIKDGLDIEFKSLHLNDIAFKYKEKWILDKLNYHVFKNEKVGISGSSGSGKSTLLQLVMRFYDPTHGEIKINDESLRFINTESLRRNQSLVTQETYLFKTSIKENIRMARLDATDEEIIEACKNASIHDVIMTFKDGYDTLISEKVNVSSGEAQRIGIARAFLSNAPLMLLDEPTANLDALNEGIVLEAIKASHQTVIMVSHRKNSLSICDKIIELEEIK